MRALALSLSVLSALASAQPVPFPVLTKDETTKLEGGGVVVHEVKPTDNRGIGVESMGLIDAPSQEVWPILRDCEHFAKFMPRTKSSAATKEDGVALCHVELRLPFPLTDLWSDTRSVQREEPAGHFHRAWTLVRGTYHRNSGSWSVLPWSDGKKTLVVYAIDSDPAMIVPDAILRSAQTGSLPEVFASIRKRVVALRTP
jgi:carbon monoxide dehydrogenase subunit G